MRFSIAPDDNELAEWSACLHRAHVTPSIKAATTIPPSAMDNADILWSIAAGISCTSKEAKHQNKIQCKQLNYIKEKDAKKNNKAKKCNPQVVALCSMQRPPTAISLSTKSPHPTFASSTATPPEWRTKNCRAKCLNSGMLMPDLPMSLPLASTWGKLCGIITHPQATSPPSTFLSWIRFRRRRRHVASTSIFFPRTPRGN